MYRSRSALLLICFLALALGACASTHYSSNEFIADPLEYLVGEWEGTASIPGAQIPLVDRILIIYPQPKGQTLKARYGIPGTSYQGPTTVEVMQSNGIVSIAFRTGSASRVSLWLQRSGNTLILNGTINTQSGLPSPMILRKK
jgi:hypothetical protein